MDYEKEISFGAFDSELMHQEITIPEGFEATIDGDKIILKKIESADGKVKKEITELVMQPTWKTEKEFYRRKELCDWLEKQGEQKSIMNVPQREVILSIWDLGNEWKELTNGSISTEYGTQLNYIQKHWHESEYYLKEKQGEQKPADKVEQKFKVGDWIVYKDSIWKICNIGLKTYYELLKINNEVSTRHIEDVDKIAHLWTIQDAKPGDVLYCESSEIEFIIILKQINNRSLDSYCRYNTIDGFAIDVPRVMSIQNNPKPATKEQRDLLFAKMKETGYEWDAEKKELKKIEQEELSVFEKSLKHIIEEAIEDGDTHNLKADAELLLGLMQKPSDDDMKEALRTEYEKGRADAFVEMQKEWSEEDKDFMYDTLSNLTELKDRYGEGYGNVGKCIDWLKSIKKRIRG